MRIQQLLWEPNEAFPAPRSPAMVPPVSAQTDPMSAPTLVFDLDGTLIDTAPDLLGTLNIILAAERLPTVPMGDARALIGHGVRALLEKGFVASGVTPPPARMDELYAQFLDHYAAHIADESRPFPGALEAMEQFAAAGWQLAICTNKLERLTRLLLERFDITHRFAAICGSDTFGVAKPDPRSLLGVVERAGGTIERAIMVGDSATDIDTARAAGIPVVAVDFGYTPVPVYTLGPDSVIGSFGELWAAVEKLRPHAFA